MPKDLKNVLDNIESSEKESAILLSKMDRLKEMIEKQKRVLTEHENIIEEQKIKITRMYDIPEDVLELKELVGTQRAMLNQRENEMELAKGEVLAIQKELEFMKKQNIPTQRKLEESFELIGNLKSELLLKEETIKSLQIKAREIQAFADRIQDEQVRLLTDMDQKWKKELEKLRLDHIEEKKDLVGKISDLDTFLLDSKLTSTEATSEAKDLKSRFQEIRDSQENMINKLEEALDKKREADEEVRKLNKEMEELRIFRQNNVKKITYYDKLTDLMEHEAQFKAFLIVEQVGSMALDDLRNALGSPIVLVKKIVQNLQKVDLFEINDAGKISVKKIE
ncbi:MAG: hypothetical protein CEE42_05555 [Promethearchaeota archaeon Loki_b31]|nr:MAG: hypothetical protein CEE42_05555 [Candidatus Lokiarchaeota archaeon Loki_b31]